MFQVKHGYRWLILGLVLALLLVSGIDATYAKLVGGVQARRPNDQAVELKLTVDADGLIKVVIGTNQITFPVKANQELDTGLLRISGDEVQVFENGQLVCKIPVNDIPTAYKRFCYDERKPVVRVSQSPSPNSYGWNNGNVTIMVTAEDEEGGSGIKSIFYKIGTRSPVEVRTAQLSISQGGRVATYSLTIPDEGTHDLGFWAVDQAGNESEHQALTVRIDKTRPTISGSRSPDPNSYGWNNGDVTVTFNCSDSLSGIASCTGRQTVSREGSGQSVTGEAVDKAGNSATATVSDINIEKTPPTSTLTSAQTGFAAGSPSPSWSKLQIFSLGWIQSRHGTAMWDRSRSTPRRTDGKGPSLQKVMEQ